MPVHCCHIYLSSSKKYRVTEQSKWVSHMIQYMSVCSFFLPPEYSRQPDPHERSGSGQIPIKQSCLTCHDFSGMFSELKVAVFTPHVSICTLFGLPYYTQVSVLLSLPYHTHISICMHTYSITCSHPLGYPPYC